MFTSFCVRLRALIRRNTAERDLADELQSHLERDTERNVARGMRPHEAAHAASRAFGNVTDARERARDAWTWRWLEHGAQDVRYALRAMRRSPAFTLVAVLSLALGIGASAAIFTLLDVTAWRTLPLPSPDRLVIVGENRDSPYLSYAVFENLRSRNSVLSGMAATGCSSSRHCGTADGFGLTVTVDGDAERTPGGGLLASGDYFTTLGVRARIGRLFTPADDRIGSENAVAVISYRYWQNRFGGGRDAIGKVVGLNGVPSTIIGVTPPEFFGTVVGTAPDVIVPLTLQPQVTHSASLLDDPRPRTLSVVGRLRDGVSLEQARAELSLLMHQATAETDPVRPTEPPVPAYVVDARHGQSPLRSQFYQPLLILMGMVALLLLIACANVANLLLARATTRRHEIGVRMALGASRGRLIRQLLTESASLAIVGASLGLLFARWIVAILLRFVSSGPQSVTLDVHPDARILGFAAAVGALTVVLFGLLPAFRATVAPADGALRDGGRTMTGARGLRIGKLLVVSQVALSMVLLIGAALIGRSVRNLYSVDPGFSRDTLVLVSTGVRRGASAFDPQAEAVHEQVSQQLQTQLRDRLQALAGVKAASLSWHSLLSGKHAGTTVAVEGASPTADSAKMINLDAVGPDFFGATGLSIVRGRGIALGDETRVPSVAVISESVARFLFGGGQALGQRIVVSALNQSFEIVGVVRDSKYNSLREQASPIVYVPYATMPSGGYATHILRLSRGAAGIPAAVRRTAALLDPRIEVYGIQTLQEQIDLTLVQERFVAMLSTFFGMAALLLACIGLYGVMTYAVTQRTREIGIRMALGAGRARILGRVLRETMLLVAGGIAIGILMAVPATHVVASLLFGLSPNDPLTIGLTGVVLVCVAIAAGYLPAQRASRVDPIISLRSE